MRRRTILYIFDLKPVTRRSVMPSSLTRLHVVVVIEAWHSFCEKCIVASSHTNLCVLRCNRYDAQRHRSEG